MSGYYDPNNPHSYSYLPPPLPDLPEGIVSPPGNFYDNGHTLIGGNPSIDQPEVSENIARWFEQDPDVGASAPKAPVKVKRRAANSDHVKHRRTRSGCFTCRSRRVKVQIPGSSCGVEFNAEIVLH